MKHLIAPLTILALLAVIGCDDKNSETAEQAVAKTRTEGPQGPKHPTTQELLTGPRHRLALKAIPFSVSTPLEWKVENLINGSIVVLTGPTPSGEAQIQLSIRPTAKKDELEIIHRAARKEATQPASQSLSKHVVKAEFRKMNDIEVFDRQAVGQPGPLTVTDAKGIEHTETATPYTWTVILFVPQGADFARYEINFIGLTAEQYEQDKPLLNEVINSIQYDASSVPATQPI